MNSAKAFIWNGFNCSACKEPKVFDKLGLDNGVLVTVIAILYENNITPLAFPTPVVVDQRYMLGEGPSNIVTHTINEARCDSNCCTRTGIHLIPGYAIPIVNIQGMIIGKNKSARYDGIKIQQTNGII